MLIALDYDETFTLNPALWRSFIRQCYMHSTKVVIVTFRDDRCDKNLELDKLACSMEVHYTRGVAKKFWMEHNTDLKVDVWIDDKPETICNNSPYTREQLIEWRK